MSPPRPSSVSNARGRPSIRCVHHRCLVERDVLYPIGPGLPPNVGDGLVPGASLLSLGFEGNLEAIDPGTGEASRVGATGLGDCSTPVSPCGPNAANSIGLIDGHYFVTDFANNLYSLNPRTAEAKLIGPTGIPGLPYPPFSTNPDGSVNVFGESLLAYRGKFYAYFSAIAVNFETGAATPQIPGAIYQIDPATGRATIVAPTASTYSIIASISNTIYAFDPLQGEFFVLDLSTGAASPSTPVDPAVGPIAGLSPAHPVSASH